MRPPHASFLMSYACHVLGHYFPLGCHLYKRDDGGQEWRQNCARCDAIRTVNPELQRDSAEWADMKYAEMVAEIREGLRQSYLASER